MSNVLPPGEEAYLPPHPEAETPEERAEREQAEHDVHVMRSECLRLIQELPFLWSKLVEGTAPALRQPPIEPPEVPLKPGELMAYRIGQHSVVEFIRLSAERATE